MLVRVEPLIEILDDAFGVNNYSRQISADFNRGFRTYPPSVQTLRPRSISWDRYERHECGIERSP